MELRGTLRSWNDDKGFGFIRPEQGGGDVFVHISAMRGDQRPEVGQTVLYLAGKDGQGRLRAEHMRSEGLSLDRPAIRRKPRASEPRKAVPSAARPAAHKPARRQPGPSIQSLPLKLVIFVGLCALPFAGSLHALMALQMPWLLLAYPLLSAVSFLQYWADKNSAQSGRWRTPENTLHITELLGGWPGALLAQQVFRHKTRKVSFQAVFWLIVLLHQAFWVDQLLLAGCFLGHLLPY